MLRTRRFRLVLLGFLLLGIPVLLRPYLAGRIQGDWSDWLFGILYGVAIGVQIIALILRPRKGDPACPGTGSR